MVMILGWPAKSEEWNRLMWLHLRYELARCGDSSPFNGVAPQSPLRQAVLNDHFAKLNQWFFDLGKVVEKTTSEIHTDGDAAHQVKNQAPDEIHIMPNGYACWSCSRFLNQSNSQACIPETTNFRHPVTPQSRKPTLLLFDKSWW